MDLHLERLLRLHTEPEHENLYKWAINETDAEGKAIGRDQIPWQWSLYFTATSCVLSDTIEVRQPLNFKFNATMQDGTATERKSGGKETIDRRQSIVMRLRSGDWRTDYSSKEPVTFKMFGTDRAIKNFTLNIVQIIDPSEKEQCSTWGCPSYTSEGADFVDQTIDDCIVFYLAVIPEAFTRYVAKINQGVVDEVVLRVAQVDGFYSEWSPSIVTDRVKVLTREREHKVTLPSGYQSEPPRLGSVGEVSLYINRKLEFGSQPQPESQDEKKTDLQVERPDQRMQASNDQQTLHALRSLKRAAWLVVWLLALILIVTLLRP